MMQAAESRTDRDVTGGRRTNSASRCSLLASRMGTILMVVADIIGKESLQVGLVEGDGMIQQIAPQGQVCLPREVSVIVRILGLKTA